MQEFTFRYMLNNTTNKMVVVEMTRDILGRFYIKDDQLVIDLYNKKSEQRVDITEYLELELDDVVKNRGLGGLRETILDYLINNYFYNHI